VPIRNLLFDVRYAARSLGKSPGFAAAAVLTLALGVGANTAVFSLVNAVLLRPLPYEQPDRLVLVWESAPFFGTRDSPVSPANYVDWKARSRSFEEMAGIEENWFRLIGDGSPEIVPGSFVTAGLWRVLRTRPMLGSVFRYEEDRPGAPKVAVIAESFWRRHFGADPRIVGRDFVLNDEKHTIVGVLAAGTEPPTEYSGIPNEIWTPIGSAYTPQQMANRGRHNWMVAARLRQGVTIAQADAEMESVGASLAREYPDTNEKVGAFVAPMRDHFVSGSRRVLFLLLGTVAFVLLIACSNVANLLLSRAVGRSKEVAVRTALGAGTWQLGRQFFSEALLLAAAGSALGLLLATATFRFLGRLAPGAMTGFKALDVDWRVFAFALAVAVATAAAFAVLPLAQVRRLNVNEALKQGSRTAAAGSGSRRLRGVLIGSEVALAFMLLIGAGLLIKTLARLRGVDLGCRTENVLTLSIPPSKTHTGPGQYPAYQREILRRIEAIPGVAKAGFTNHIPLVVKGDISGVIGEGHDAKDTVQCNFRVAGPGYLRAMGIPLRRGRDIDERDGEGAPYVALINETLARKLWPGQDPIGRRIMGENRVGVQVVGVVGDIHQSGLEVPPSPEFYLSALQVGPQANSVAIHTSVDAASVAPAVRKAIWAVDPDQPITGLATMEDILDKEVFQRRTQMTLLTAFAGLALVLAAIGLYSVLAYLVGQQVPEIGIRMALGAAPADIARRTVGHGLKLAGIGLACGLAGAVALSRLITTVLFGVEPTDPATYATMAAVLLVTAAAASYLPARRAMRVDPAVALRDL
jgi:predicted permease